jgi:hypothetical protein
VLAALAHQLRRAALRVDRAVERAVLVVEPAWLEGPTACDGLPESRLGRAAVLVGTCVADALEGVARGIEERRHGPSSVTITFRVDEPSTEEFERQVAELFARASRSAGAPQEGGAR